MMDNKIEPFQGGAFFGLHEDVMAVMGRVESSLVDPVLVTSSKRSSLEIGELIVRAAQHETFEPELEFDERGRMKPSPEFLMMQRVLKVRGQRQIDEVARAVGISFRSDAIKMFRSFRRPENGSRETTSRFFSWDDLTYATLADTLLRYRDLPAQVLDRDWVARREERRREIQATQESL